MTTEWISRNHRGLQSICESKQVTLSTHWGADADGLGSALALRSGLATLGIRAKVIIPNPLFRRVAFLDWNQEVEVWHQESAASKWMAESDLVVLLDTTSLGTHEELGQAVERSKLPIVSIDHHLGESSELDIVAPDAAATGEMVYHILRVLDVDLTEDMASWLFASISSDTCSFRFVRGRAETFRMAATLIEAGADPWRIQEGLYQSVSTDTPKLFSRACERMKLISDGKVVLVWLEAGVLDDLSLDRDDHRDLIQFLIAQEGVQAAVTVTERDEGDFKLSFRGRKGMNLQPIAKSFGGGGHAQACGATVAIDGATLQEQLITKLAHIG